MVFTFKSYQVNIEFVMNSILPSSKTFGILVKKTFKMFKSNQQKKLSSGVFKRE